MSTIEEVWLSLRDASGGSFQRRVDADHPHDIYLDFEPPSRFGLVAVCNSRPPVMQAMRSVMIDQTQRADGRWFLRISLERPDLFPVFSALCRDIIDSTRAETAAAALGSAVASRLDRWRKLLERDVRALGINELLGLIGELCVLEQLLDEYPLAEAVASWIGPHGTPQDFMLPDGSRIEVKAARTSARTVQIHGLHQLEAECASVVLVVARLDETTLGALGSFTAPAIIRRILARLEPVHATMEAFMALLSLAGWSNHPEHETPVVRLVALEHYPVGPGFPKLTRRTVPIGIADADYTILLPPRFPTTHLEEHGP